MKTTLVSNQKPEPGDPWRDIKYPCLVETPSGEYIAIATSANAGIRIHGAHVGTIHQGGSSWRNAGWVPVKRPVTITFEN